MIFFVFFLRSLTQVIEKYSLVYFNFQVIFPTGVKVDIERNYWGIDVTILTNRAQGKESGICLYEERMDRALSIDDYGRLQRYDLKPAKELGLIPIII